ncbi:MAG: OmpA family protein [Deltaproteobacteria bacterium]|nr:OmpA family protein [Deltaproteobacteria bacterium]
MSSFLSRCLIPVVVGAATVGCATPQPPAELVEARHSYGQAAGGATMRVNPAGVDTARDKLAAAEIAFDKEPKAQETKDAAYLADRSARLAIAQGQSKLAVEQTEAAQKQLGYVAKKSQSDLQKTKQELAVTQTKGRATEAQLQAQRAELADQRAKGLINDQQLNDANAALAATSQALDAERVARAEAEKKASEALANLAKMAAVKEDTRGIVITLSGQVLFASGKSALLPAAQLALDNVVDALKANPDRNIIIEGHTDSQGAKAFNQELSQARASSVRLYLIDKGIPAEVVSARGFGPDQPVADNNTADGRANNRRVEIVISPAERK